MAFDKAKVLKAAEKFLAQGKISAAIKEYRQIVDNDTDDLTALNMLGDLHARAGEDDDAILCFDRIAEHFREQEFNLKAIAMYKKIERLKPRDPFLAHKLGELYATQGLVVDARAQYLIVADAYTRAGQNRKALDILHKIADLDPNNTDIRLKLADGYLNENMPREAAGAFAQAASRLHQTGRDDRALTAYAKALEIQPDNTEVLTGMLETHIARQTADEAAEVLERIVHGKEDDNFLVSLLARAYIEAEDAQGAERAIAMLMTQDASNYTQFITVARLYLKAGEIDQTVRVLASIIERMLAGREEKDLLEIVNQVLERNPDHVPALRMLVRIHWWQRDMDALRATLERMAESAEASGLVDDERYALTQLVRQAPEETRYLERLNEIGGLQEEAVEDFSTAPDISSTEVPDFDSFSIISQPATDKQEPATMALEFESNQADSLAASKETSFAELNDTAEAAVSSVPASQDFQEVDFGDGAGTGSHPVSSGAAETGGASRETLMKQELESVDFYITQGYADIAVDTLQMLEKQFGAHPDIVARRKKLTASQEQAPASDAVFEFGGAEPLAKIEEADMSFATLSEEGRTSPAVRGSTRPVVDSGLSELFEEFRMAEEKDDVSKEDYETHYNMGTAYKEMDLLDEAIHEFQTSAALVKPSDGTSRFLQCCNMLGHCFMQKGVPRAAVIWFKKGLDAPGQNEDEYQALRYELALAYELLGDIDNALHLYTEVYGADVSYRDVAKKLKKLGKK